MSSIIRNFIVTFCVSLLIFGLLSYAIVTNVDNVFSSPDNGPADTADIAKPLDTVTGEMPANSETDAEGNVIKPSDGNDVTFLLVGTDYQPDILNDYDVTDLNTGRTGFPIKPRAITADAIMIMKANSNTKEFVFSMIPSDMRVQADGNDVKLGSLYSSKGIHYLRNKVTAMTGLKIDYYAVASVTGLAAIIDEIEGINVTVPIDMNYEDETQQLYIHIDKGSQTLNGTQAVNMLRYKLYPNGDASRRALIETFARAVLKKMTDPSMLAKVSDLYNLHSKHVETDFTLSDLVLHLDLIFSYPEYTSTDIVYPGIAGTVESNTYFEPDLNAAINIYRKYR